MVVKVVTPPTKEPVSVEEIKSYIPGVNYNDQDDHIASFIQAARIKIEHRCGYCIVTQTLQETFPGFTDMIRLERAPVSDVTSLKYIDGSGSQQTIADTEWEFSDDDFGAFIIPKDAWPTDVATKPNAVTVQYVAGHDVDDVPEQLRQAIRLLVGSYFENRENELLVPVRQELMLLHDGVEALIAPYVMMRL